MYKSAGRLRYETDEVYFVPDSNHCVQRRISECKKVCGAAFVDDLCNGTVKPLQEGKVKLKIESADHRIVALAAAASQVKVEVEVTVEDGKPLMLTGIVVPVK